MGLSFRRERTISKRRRTTRIFATETLEIRTLFAADPTITPLSTYATGQFDKVAAEIPAYDPETQRIFITNSAARGVDVLDASNPSNISKLFTIDTSAFGDPTSVAVDRNVVAVAIPNDNHQLPGVVAFYKTNGELLKTLTVGALPDMVTFTPDGKRLLVANEGEPKSYSGTAQDVSVDPEGSISIISIPGGHGNIKKLTQASVQTATFTAFNGNINPNVRIFGPGATVAQDLEPEYIAVSADSTKAYVSLQENNAFAVVDIATATVQSLIPFGFKDHSVAGNGLDVSDQDGINIALRPVHGMYQADVIATYTVGGQTYLVTANEGDAREYTGFVEAARLASIPDEKFDPDYFTQAEIDNLQATMGRLNVTTAADIDGDGLIDQIRSFGGRSFSIWTTSSALVFDSGDQLEQLTAIAYPANFNASSTTNALDNRLDDKGPEPESLTIGQVDGRTYAFLGLERMGGVMMFDITVPSAPVFVNYVNNRDFTKSPSSAPGVSNPEAKDLAPEGIVFVSAANSPTGQPLLIVANEVSGTTTVYRFGPASAAPLAPLTLSAPSSASAPSKSAVKSSPVASARLRDLVPAAPDIVIARHDADEGSISGCLI